MSRSQQVFAQYNLVWNNLHRHVSRGAHCLNTSLRAQLHAATLYWQVTFHALTHISLFFCPSTHLCRFPSSPATVSLPSAPPPPPPSPSLQTCRWTLFLPHPPLQLMYNYLNFTESPPVRLDVITAIGLPAGESTPVSLFLSAGAQFHSSIQGCRY